MTFRRWAAGLIGSVSQWLQDKPYPPYTERVRRGIEKPQYRTDCAIYVSGPVGPALQQLYERMESRGWSN